MSTYWETICTETAVGFDIVFYAAPEEDDPRDHFDDEETVQGIKDGRYAWFVARVEARREGITLGTDYLHRCCYDSPQQFCEAPSDYYGGMVENAVEEARTMLTKLCATNGD
jgi:hypothetical protein